ncbi:ligand-binding sensor domain-containing protein [Ramlibacter alkalitolerans]|uniref:Regulator n=1 Tax=Ramlibacter alkalitolerans TaxID=2039631 RepID=A0ABS1JIU2_9BURK|nr:two-component regulator propeller domain-containing protein [Ramlibacter alkalitolerans]MBL0424150.1 regulator [Ramlibacter alkalitolerans]
MQFGHKTIAVLVIALGGVIAGAYTLGRGAGNPGTAQTAPVAAKAMGAATDAAPAANIQAPAGHPPVAEGGAPPTEGKVQIDPAAKFVHFRVGNRNVKDILTEDNVVWVGTSGGVIRYDTRTDEFKLFDTRAGLLSNGVFHISRLDGRLAVGTYGGGLSLLDEKTGKWETFNIPDGLGDAFVYDVLKAKNGDVWIATWSGVNRIKGGNLKDRSKWELHTVASTKGGLPNDWVYGLAEGKDGIVWLATEGGLARWVEGKWDNWNHAKGQGAPYELVKDDLAFKNDPSKVSSHHARQKQEMGLQGIDTAYNPNYIVSLVADKDGSVWAGTWGGGLAHFDGKQFRNYTVKDGLPGNHVFMLHQAKDGQLYIGTNAGVTKFDNGKFTAPLTTADGLFSNTVFSMDTGADGSLWVGSFGGVAHIGKK